MRSRDPATGRPLAVTFDCWSTLITERDPGVGYERRLEALVRVVSARGVERAAARAALDTGWGRHLELWGEGIASGASEIAAWSLEALDVRDPQLAAELGAAFAEASLESEIVALEGAVETLAVLAEAGVRRALVCDTGFSPGRVVRRLLDREGLLEWLEVQVFSDEAGAPKPHPQVFHAALEPLGVEPGHAVHVGDLRRTDVAGARAVGMRSVRIRDHHDDTSEHPEADAVADSHAHLRELLGVG